MAIGFKNRFQGLKEKAQNITSELAETITEKTSEIDIKENVINVRNKSQEYGNKIMSQTQNVASKASNIATQAGEKTSTLIKENEDEIIEICNTKIKPALIEAGNSAIQNDDLWIKVAETTYEFLPTPIRLVITQKTFVDFVVANKHQLISDDCDYVELLVDNSVELITKPIVKESNSDETS